MSQTFSYTNNELDNTPTAAKVAEVFLTAGHAFQKLGDLTLRLNQPISENTNETKWSEKDVDRLKEALNRFAHDLDNISESVQSRIVQKIKTDIKRRSLISGNSLDPMLKVPLNSSINNSSDFARQNSINSTESLSSTLQSVNYSVPSGSAPAHLQQNSGNIVEIKQEEYSTSPPQLVPASNLQVQQNRGFQQTRDTVVSRIKRPVNSVTYNNQMAISGNRNLINSSGNVAPPYKKTYSGLGVTTSFRPIRTISAAVNSSPGGGRSISLLRSGNIGQQHSTNTIHRSIATTIHHQPPLHSIHDFDDVNMETKLNPSHSPTVHHQQQL